MEKQQADIILPTFTVYADIRASQLANVRLESSAQRNLSAESGGRALRLCMWLHLRSIDGKGERGRCA